MPTVNLVSQEHHNNQRSNRNTRPSQRRNGRLEWPSSCGFQLWGSGPCYVVHVERHSLADEASLRPGDQVLELGDGQHISHLSASQLISQVRRQMAQQVDGQPPALGVVSRLQLMEVEMSRNHGYGFLGTDEAPVVAYRVVEDGPAYKTGLREGDPILKVNGVSINTPGDLQRLLTTGTKLLLEIIALPKSQPSLYGDDVDSVENRYQQISRSDHAVWLYKKLNQVFGGDDLKKRAVVSSLKQYAQSRDIEELVRSLNGLLRHTEERQLIEDIKPFIPERQTQEFHYLVEQHFNIQGLTSPSFTDISPNHSGTLAYQSLLATSSSRLSINLPQASHHRNLGVTLRGGAPVAVDDVVTGSQADEAGLREGDYLSRIDGLDISQSSKGHVEDLLKRHLEHGPAKLDIIRNTNAGYFQSSVNSTQEAQQFKEKVENILSADEKKLLKTYLEDYKETRDISTFTTEVSALINTDPDKAQLWHFLLPKLPPHHRDKCVDILVNAAYPPRGFVLPRRGQTASQSPNHKSDGDPKSSHSETLWVDQYGVPQPRMFGENGSKSDPVSSVGQFDHLGSFKQQLEYLLTSRERSELKKSLQSYAHDSETETEKGLGSDVPGTEGDIDSLIMEIELLLDTPSKRTLWLYIIPLLSKHHQPYCREKLKLPHSLGTSSAMLQSEYRHSQTNGKKSEYAMINEAANILKRNNASDASHHRSSMSPLRLETSDSQHQAYRPTRNSSSSNQSSGDVDSAWHTPVGVSFHRDSFNQTDTNRDFLTPVDIDYVLKDGYHHSDHNDHNHSGPYGNNSIFGMDGEPIHASQIPPGSRLLLIDSDNGGENGLTDIDSYINSDIQRDGGHGRHNGRSMEWIRARLGDPKVRLVGDEEFGDNETYDAAAMEAIQALDDIVENEEKKDQEGIKGVHDASISVLPPVPLFVLPPQPPVPPPPLIPPPPPSPNMRAIGGVKGEGEGGMNVKRLNWDKLDVRNIETTIWGQLNADTALEEIVNFLELDEQFAMSKPKTRIPSFSKIPQKKKVCILDQKKAYNLSILLAHLKLTPVELRIALYEMNDDIYTQELLEHFIKYAPNAEEIEWYNAYTGNYDDLSPPDKFCYTMTRIPAFKQRLEAMLFKSGYSERVESLTKILETVRRACGEICSSKKLSRILELILAMGNFLNRGHTRIGEATAIKISSLNKLEFTKTADGKTSFLHVLAETVHQRYPEAIALREDLPSVADAAKAEKKASNAAIKEEIESLKTMIEESLATMLELTAIKNPTLVKDVKSWTIEEMVEKLNSVSKGGSTTEDKFQNAMVDFLQNASSVMKRLLDTQVEIEIEVQNMVRFFGEDMKNTLTEDVFFTFANFINSFERAHNYNITHKRR